MANSNLHVLLVISLVLIPGALTRRSDGGGFRGGASMGRSSGGFGSGFRGQRQGREEASASGLRIFEECSIFSSNVEQCREECGGELTCQLVHSNDTGGLYISKCLPSYALQVCQNNESCTENTFCSETPGRTEGGGLRCFTEDDLKNCNFDGKRGTGNGDTNTGNSADGARAQFPPRFPGTSGSGRRKRQALKTCRKVVDDLRSNSPRRSRDRPAENGGTNTGNDGQITP